ncbi:MAG: UDP-N-acetylglucosamine 2-epimerase (non-hydrolyzing) [Alphaproteobacteria bacterium]|nr:UDP-N-acetylglucosamine 2-epimerase (non-hydrolyzing) [Alphaproteobacteria bacterium]NCQ87661.1 UDP-N-acetylglucosamine 2-epimerase (non-hydrolyzing) [Alphaproteobacteria bacterium]NCT05830.1 UDP-N-acetylglucosamine 2-epimerase (non-hydrolyzing) [Alphaproteobacteria bacterium]
MKILTVLGTRPEIIRLSLIIKKLDDLCDHVLVHTGQNFDKNLSDLFFDELRIRKPDHHLEVKGTSAGDQIGQIIQRCETVFNQEKPDKILILGDTNSALCSIIAKRMGVPVYHMEAGNRCFEEGMPEEINRKIIDSCSDILLPYTHRSKENLFREGYAANRVYVTGNPILEVINHYSADVEKSTILQKHNLTPQNYFLATIHRAGNVDVPARFNQILESLNAAANDHNMPVVVSVHPRMREKLQSSKDVVLDDRIKLVEPFGFFDFIKLEKEAFCVLSDSGTVQEECAIFGVPNVTLRDVTERPETIDCGSNILSGAKKEDVIQAIKVVTSLKPTWIAPPEYLNENVSDTVCRILFSIQNK